jgi:hypothetical protein
MSKKQESIVTILEVFRTAGELVSDDDDADMAMSDLFDLALDMLGVPLDNEVMQFTDKVGMDCPYSRNWCCQVWSDTKGGKNKAERFIRGVRKKLEDKYHAEWRKLVHEKIKAYTEMLGEDQ